MKYRSRTDIIASLLRIATDHGGATKMQLMYGAYLSYAQLKEYLHFLQEKDLLEYEQGSQAYKVTDKARSLLRAYEEMNSMIGDTKSQRRQSPGMLFGEQ